MNNEISFCELRTKQVINIIDGKVLGRICDVVFSRTSSKVLGFVVPGANSFSIFRKKSDMFIPFERICKIGCDVVLVELKPLGGHHEILNAIPHSTSHSQNHSTHAHP